MRFFHCFALAACVAFFSPAFAVDATFGPALSTNPAGTAQATFSAAPATTVNLPAVIVPPTTIITQPSWLDTLYIIAGSPAFLAAAAYLLIKLETYLQAKTKIDLGRATGIAHSLFNTLFDMGLIKNGRFRDAEEAFFQNFNTQYFNAYGKQPSDAIQDTAHSQFAQMFTANTPDALPSLVVETKPTA